MQGALSFVVHACQRAGLLTKRLLVCFAIKDDSAKDWNVHLHVENPQLADAFDVKVALDKLGENFRLKNREFELAYGHFQLALKKQGKKKEEMMIHRKYSKEVLGFHAWMRQWIRKVFF